MAVRETWNRQRSVKEWNFTVVQSVQPRKDGTEVVPFSYSHIYGQISSGYFCRSCEETLKLEKLKVPHAAPHLLGQVIWVGASGVFWLEGRGELADLASKNTEPPVNFEFQILKNDRLLI